MAKKLIYKQSLLGGTMNDASEVKYGSGSVADVLDNLYINVPITSTPFRADNTSVGTIEYPQTAKLITVMGISNSVNSGAWSVTLPTLSNVSTFFPIFNNNSLLYLVQASVSPTNHTISFKTVYSGNTNLNITISNLYALTI